MEDKKQNIYYVYLHRRDDTNDVFYIGKGSGQRAKSISGRNDWWRNIYNKCGFTPEIVEKGLSEESAYNLEVELIKFYRDCGYKLCNIADGGGGASRKQSEETKKKISLKLKGRLTSEETRKKLSIANTGKTGRPAPNRKAVECSNGMIFDCMPLAVAWLKSLGFEKAGVPCISECCRGTQKTAYGFKWEFASVVEENLLEEAA